MGEWVTTLFLQYEKRMVKEKIQKIIDDSARDLGYNIYKSSIYLKRGSSKISVKIDNDNKEWISHEDCEKYSRELSNRLDREAVIPNYSIEISSPGFKRSLKTIKEYKRFTGAPVKVIYNLSGKKEVIKCRIKDAADEIVEFCIGDEIIKISLDKIIKSNLDY